MARKGHAGETSRGHTKAKPISKNEGFKRLKELINEGGRTKTQPTSVSKIQKVVFLLQDHEKFDKYFEPRAVALGPIHHGTEKLQLAEEYKLKLTYEFIKGSGKNEDELYHNVKQNIDELKKCFDEKVIEEIDNEALAWMLFVDGCAILQFIYCDVHGKFKELGLKRDSVAFGLRDLFLLENQLPYRLLELLMSCSNKQTELRKSIDTFIHNSTNYTAPPQKQWMWSCFTRSCSQPQSPEHSISIEGEPTHLLDLLRTRLIGTKTNGPPSKKQNLQYSCRNVQELRAAGIRLQPSESSFLRNISFTRYLNFYPGYLKLPHITVDDSTGPKFMNLIAYEMCPDFDNDFDVSSYILFLDSLIDHATDVQKLRRAGILHNLLGSDEQVAQLFNEIGTDLVPNPYTYSDVKDKIQSYYNCKCTSWIAQGLHNHFNSPWTVLAFLGAVVALLLSGIQVWYAANPPPGPLR